MMQKNLTAVTAILLSVVFFSCKKEFVETSSVNGETVSSNITANDVLETALPIHTPRYTKINSNCLGYMETLPARYSLTTKKYPLIIFIHGIGELGTGVTRLNCCGLPYYAKRGLLPPKFLNSADGKYYSYIVVSPQFLVRPNASQIQSVINFAKSKYRVDASRIYVVGMSMGGGSTWDWSVVYGQYAAAISPVCAGSRPTTTLASYVATKNLPIWSLNSNDDAVVPIQWGKDWINWIDARNSAYASKTKLTIWYGLSHNSTWAKAFNPTTKVDGYSMYEWLLKYTRGTSTSGTTATSTSTSGNKVPYANAGTDQKIPLSWNYMPTVNATKSTDADGWIKSFRWTKISGPSSYWFSNSSAAQTKVNGLVAGTYVFRVTVTDNDGATDYDDVTIVMTSSTSTSSNGYPVAKAGADQTIPLSWKYMPTLNGTGSYDSDGYIKAFKWTKISGPSSYWFSPSSSSAKATAEGLVAGTYIFRLTVTDNSGKTDYDDVTITMTK
jgi:hypothetical protein